MTTPKVHHMHPSLLKYLPLYRKVRDALGGEEKIKARRELYLPNPTTREASSLKDKQSQSRYDAYIARANYYNVTRRTLLGLVGQVFIKDPEIELPESLKILEKDASGKGLPLAQEAKKALRYTLPFSRSGVFVDYPYVDSKVTTVADLDSNKIRPTLHVYRAEEIINWRTIEKESSEVISLVVLYETYVFEDDGFEIKDAEQYRVLALDAEGYYYQSIWREDKPTLEKKTNPYDISRERSNYKKEIRWTKVETFYPTDYNGNRFTEIPFKFIGSVDNDPDPDYPNFYDFACLNIAHYRNSADYEEGVWLSGQPTLVITGLTQQWVDEQLDGEIVIGSRGAITTPEGGNAKLLEMTNSLAAFEAMQHKEKQMVALGAKLVEQRKVERTATEVKLEATADGSVLSNTANNVSSAFRWALRKASEFVGKEPVDSEFQLNIEYDLVRMSSDDVQQIVNTWKEGLLSTKESRKKLKEGGLAFEEDDLVMSEYWERKEKEIEMQRKQFAADQNNNNQQEEGKDEEDN